MILDGVLQLDWGEGRGTGAAAAPVLMAGWHPPEPRHRIAERSLLALKLASQIGFSSPVEASRWLYGFGVLPAAPQDAMSGRWRRGLVWSTDRAALERIYRTSANATWETWTRRGRTGRGAPLHKLYVSPDNGALDDVVHETAQLLCRDPAPAFKLVVDRRGANRPDKLIVYFDRADERDRWVGLLADKIAGCGGHGVPFTDQLDDVAALSVATDPPPGDRADKVASWRSWSTDRLGWSLAMARAPDRSEVTPWAFALFRLSLEGVDTSRWALSR